MPDTIEITVPISTVLAEAAERSTPIRRAVEQDIGAQSFVAIVNALAEQREAEKAKAVSAHIGGLVDKRGRV